LNLAFCGKLGTLRRVKRPWANPLFCRRYLLAAAAGFALAASLPKIGIAGLAWVAPALLVAAALGKRGAESFRIGYIGALTHYLVMLYWLLLIPDRWHGIPLGPALGWLALSGFLALFPAAWLWLVSGFSPWSKVRTTELSAGGNWMRRMVWTLIGAASWVAFEMVLARLFGGFPWDLIGVSQYQMVPLIQVASVTGVYGVSFLVVWVSLSLFSAGMMVLQRPAPRSVWVAEVFLPVLVVAVLFNLGFRAIRRAPDPARALKVTLVQPSTSQTLIWDPTKDEERFQDLLRLTELALTNPADLLIWPESALPKPIRYDAATRAAVTNLARTHHVWMIIGSDDIEPRPGAIDPEDRLYFNGSFLISPEGEIVERYLKRNLVIFGEYLPAKRWLPFLKYLTPIQGEFTPGTNTVSYDLRNLAVRTSVLICFEDIFPQLARCDVAPDVDFLVNITNDGWFGDSAAQWQQAATSLFRAVENRVPLIRCANNGLTCWVDAYGRLRQVFRDDRGTIYGPGFMTAEIPLVASGQKPALTFYNRHGDWFGWACVGFAALALAWQLRGSRPNRQAL
jgi:apolipoprotein N-acyltransferase